MPNHQIGNQIKGSIPSRTNVHCQPSLFNNKLVKGAEPATARGWHRFQKALARALSFRGNQLASNTVVAGNTPLSATPSRNRIISNCRKVCDNPQPTAQIPQATRKMLITLRALQCE